jgi:GTPase SAR1 family protein
MDARGQTFLSRLENIYLTFTNSIPDVPILLIGNKKDIRSDETAVNEMRKLNQHPVKYEDGQKMAEQVGAYAYLECSAKTKEVRLNF